VLATLFTAWEPASLNPAEVVGDLLQKLDKEGAPETSGSSGPEGSDLPQAVRIGIVAGHSGPHPDTGLNDPGAECDDGLTELEVNEAIAAHAVRQLEDAGAEVDLLQEFDERLYGYRAAALVSIHADACTYINDQATGYKVSRSFQSSVPDLAQRLVSCIVDRYGKATGLRFHPGSITQDMTQYHSFFEIHNQTPAAIIETGFLYLDRDFLTENPEQVARGITDGILCYLNQEPVNPWEELP
jgi:N-acetylmuramoyl-L-alanine amidase